MTRRLRTQFASFAVAALMTLVMLGSVDRLATSQPPAGLVAQMAHAANQA